MTADAGLEGSVSLFDRCDWLYAFMREHCFRDDTRLIATALWPDGEPPRGALVVDLGCGPGTYARRLATAHPQVHTLGIDSSVRQVARARVTVARQALDNCTFVEADAQRLPLADARVDAAVASRLLMVLPDPAAALAEAHRVLKPGGRCFIAEPRSPLRGSLPLVAMQLMGGRGGAGAHVHVLPDRDLDRMLAAVPWRIVSRHRDRWYSYAVCEKQR